MASHVAADHFALGANDPQDVGAATICTKPRISGRFAGTGKTIVVAVVKE
jgi:hypothetical protein